MKKILAFVAAVLFVLGTQAQTVNVHKVDGSIVKNFASEIEQIDFLHSHPAPAGLEAVDLDLPSGLKWANMNVGATSVTDGGMYFAWGETTGYGTDPSDGRYFEWKGEDNDYEFGDSLALSKYNATDGKVILEPVDDAATANWGNGWRMPTSMEFTELVNTKKQPQDYEWTWCDGTSVKYEGSSMPGWKIMSKKPGTAGNHIFLPAAGFRFKDEIYFIYPDLDGGSRFNPGDNIGGFWTSELYTGNSYRAYIRARVITYNQERIYSRNDVNLVEKRAHGLTVRAVKY